MESKESADPPRPRAVRSPLPPSLTGSTGFLLSWVAARASEHFNTALAEVGLTAHQLGVMTLLLDGPQVQARLSEQLTVFQPVMVTLVNELEALGLVERRPHPNDKRALEVHLKPAGRERLRLAEVAMARSTDEIFRALDQSERAQLHDMLLRMSEPDPDPEN
jgi:DNA-binding MarR family transcriptional regulator